MNHNSFLHETTSKIHLKSSSIICTWYHHIILLFAFALSFMVGGSLISIDTLIDDDDHQEDEGPDFIDVPEDDNDKGKS